MNEQVKFSILFSENRGLSEELNAAAKSLTDKISSTVQRLEEKEETADKDGEKAKEALQKANKAQHKATDSSKKVIMAQKELQEISAILSTVEEPGETSDNISAYFRFQDRLIFAEPGLLEELARRVEEAESKFRAADLDQKLKALEEAKQRQVNNNF